MTDHQEIWCQPADQPKRQFLVMFDDPQMDVAVFDDEAEARAYWERANLNWTCYLMGTMPRSPSAQTNTDGTSEIFEAMWKNHRDELLARVAELEAQLASPGTAPENHVTGYPIEDENYEPEWEGHELVEAVIGLQERVLRNLCIATTSDQKERQWHVVEAEEAYQNYLVAFQTLRAWLASKGVSIPGNTPSPETRVMGIAPVDNSVDSGEKP